MTTNPKIKSVEQLKQDIEKQHQETINQEVTKYIYFIECRIRQALKNNTSTTRFYITFPCVLHTADNTFDGQVYAKLLEVLQEIYTVYEPKQYLDTNIEEIILNVKDVEVK